MKCEIKGIVTKKREGVNGTELILWSYEKVGDIKLHDNVVVSSSTSNNKSSFQFPKFKEAYKTVGVYDSSSDCKASFKFGAETMYQFIVGNKKR